MAHLGTGYIDIAPKFPGLANSIKSALGGVDATSTGTKWGAQLSSGMGGGLVKSGAVMGVFSALTNKALSSISQNLGAAISRFDTLNNYPRVMQSLGYSTKEADASIKKMSDRLLGLPTTLDSMVGTVQGISVITKDLDLATNAGLALNDMLLASGSSQQLVTAATEQFRQMLSKGKPDMQDWKSLVQAMPGQLDQVAKAMLGPTANANDLYAALGGGKNEAKFTMDDLLDTIVKLDQEGGAGFDSFESQARKATGGVQTSMANLNTAISRGLAGIMDEIGQENIAGVFNDMKDGINSAFSVIQSGVKDAVPVVKYMYSTFKDIAPTLAASGAGFVAFQGAAGILTGVAAKGRALNEALSLASSGAGTLAESFAAVGLKANPAAIGIGLAGAAIGALALYAYDAYQKEEKFKTATTGLNEAVSNTVKLNEYSDKISNIGQNSQFSAMSVDELTDAMVKHSEKIAATTKAAQEQVSALNTAKEVIAESVGQTDLDTQAQGRLEYALKVVNEQLGLNLTAADVMNGKYKDAQGNVQDLTGSLDDLIAKKIEEIRIEAMSDNLGEAYKAQADAADAYAAALKKSNDAQRELNEAMADPVLSRDMNYMQGLQKNAADAAKDLEKAAAECDAADSAVQNLENGLYDASKAAGKAADEFDKWGNQLNTKFTSILKSNGQDLGHLKEDLRGLGFSIDDLRSLSEADLEVLASTYNGTADSILDALNKMEGGLDKGKIVVMKNAFDMSNALNDFKNNANGALDGIDLNDLGRRLLAAGISAQQMQEMGSANFIKLAQECNGNVDAMIAAIQNYNNTEMPDKNTDIHVDDGQLVNAQGEVYTWNDSDLKDQKGSAWIEGNLKSAINWANEWNNLSLVDHWGKAAVNIFQNITQGNARGGIRPHADGGFIPRFHAGGAIATKAVPLDIVGEAGAEAIVPLTNKKYSQPFIDLIAQGVSQKVKEGSTQVFNVYLNDVRVNDDEDIKENTMNLLKTMHRKGVM